MLSEWTIQVAAKLPLMDEPTLTSLTSSLTSLGCGFMTSEQHPLAGDVSSNTSNTGACNFPAPLRNNHDDGVLSQTASPHEEVASNSVSSLQSSRRSSEELAADIIALPGWKLTFSELAGPAGGLSLSSPAVAAQQSGLGGAGPQAPAAALRHTAAASPFISAAVAGGSPLSFSSANSEATAWSNMTGGATLPHGSPWGPLLSPLTEGAATQWQAAGEAGSPYELTPYASGEEGGGVASSAWLPRALMDEM